MIRTKDVVRKMLPFGAVLILLAAVLAVDGCSNGNQDPAKAQTATAAGKGEEDALDTAAKVAMSANTTNGKKILYWRAPMDPTYISDKPGKSPMGMDLIPVYEGENLSGGPTVVIDPVTMQNMGVQTTPVRTVNLYRVIRTVGYLNYNEETLQRVNIKFSGWVEKLYVNETGQRVKKGQPLLSIYSPDLVATQEEYLVAYRNAKRLSASTFTDISRGGESLLESSRRRLLYWDISEDQIHELERTGKVSKTITLYAPSNGVVVKKMVEAGMRVMPGMDLYQMADLSKLWLYGQIYQDEVPFVREGQPVEVQVSYIPGKTYRGKVDFVYPFLDQKTRNVNVRIVVPNANFELKPEMFATVQFASSVGSNVTAIPSDAIIRTGTRNVVFVAKGGGKFEPRDVILGPEGQNSLVQVLAGVQPGENVVTSAQFMIDSESRLKEAIQKMLEAKNQGPTPVSPEGTQHSMTSKRSGHDGAENSGEGTTYSGGAMTASRGKDQVMGDMNHAEAAGKAGKSESGAEEMANETVVDPVCHMSIPPDEELAVTYRGKKYYFCSDGDMEKFRSDPEKYIHG